jgi:hypothetical protein
MDSGIGFDGVGLCMVCGSLEFNPQENDPTAI